MPFSYGNTEADGSLRVTVVDGLTYTGQFAADSSMNILVVSGNTYVGLVAPCGAVNVVLVTSDQTGSVIHPSGALVCSESPYYKGTIRITSTAPIVLDAPTLDWDDEVTDNLPDFTMTWDAAVGDIATLRRSTANDFASYDDATDTIDSLAQILEFDFGDWADGVWYVKGKYSRNAVSSDFSNVETVTIDTTGAALSSPTDTSTGTTTASLSATTSENNVTVYTVVTTASTTPDAAKIAAGQDHLGVAAAYASNAVKATAGAQAFSATGLTAATTYYAHFVGKDSNGNYGTPVSADGFTTDADELAFEGVMAKLNADVTAQNLTSLSLLSWNGTDIYDVTSWHDPASNNTRLTVPSGVSRARFFSQIGLGNTTANETLELTLRKNGAAGNLATGQVIVQDAEASTFPVLQTCSYPMSVSPGDYFEEQIQVQADTSVDYYTSHSYFAAMKAS